jgi:hypothetical protein
VSFLSETEMERCVPLCGVRMPMRWVCGVRMPMRCVDVCAPVWGEDAHEMGVSFEMKRCVPL